MKEKLMLQTLRKLYFTLKILYTHTPYRLHRVLGNLIYSVFRKRLSIACNIQSVPQIFWRAFNAYKSTCLSDCSCASFTRIALYERI